MCDNNEMSSSPSKYNHAALTDELDSLNRQLEEMRETLLNTSVRAHILEADLASLYNPEVAEAMRRAVQDCDSCSLSIYGENSKQTS